MNEALSNMDAMFLGDLRSGHQRRPAEHYAGEADAGDAASVLYSIRSER